MREERGVMIPIKEMYAVLQEIKSQVSMIELEVKQINKMDERSQKALSLANDAYQKASDLEKQLDKVESRQQWLQGLIVSAVALGVIGTLFQFIQKGILGG